MRNEPILNFLYELTGVGATLAVALDRDASVTKSTMARASLAPTFFYAIEKLYKIKNKPIWPSSVIARSPDALASGRRGNLLLPS